MINLKTLTVAFNQPMDATAAFPITVGSELPKKGKFLAAWVGVVSGYWSSEVQVSLNAASSESITVSFFNPYPFQIPVNSSGTVPDVTATIVIAYDL